MNEIIIEIPTYEVALERHEDPLDIFVSRWEPVDSRSYKKSFREDLESLIEFIIFKKSDEKNG